MFDYLRGRTPGAIDEAYYREFAVMVALVMKDGKPQVVFEKRAGSLKRQPGEICLPGGARDKGETSQENAVRETVEELHVKREQIQIIAQMDTFFTVYNNKISVYLCELTDYEMTYESEEVEEIFMVPLEFFLTTKPECYINTVRIHPAQDFPYDRIPGGEAYNWHNGSQKVYFYEYEDKVIWGMTAYIMRSVADIIKTEAEDKR